MRVVTPAFWLPTNGRWKFFERKRKDPAAETRTIAERAFSLTYVQYAGAYDFRPWDTATRDNRSTPDERPGNEISCIPRDPPGILSQTVPLRREVDTLDTLLQSPYV